MRELTPQAVAALRDTTEIQIIDVREPWEYELCHIEGTLHIPLGQIPARLAELASDRPLIVLCHHGMRSLQVAHYLLSQGYQDVTNLSGGIDAWARDIDPALALY